MLSSVTFATHILYCRVKAMPGGRKFVLMQCFVLTIVT